MAVRNWPDSALRCRNPEVAPVCATVQARRRSAARADTCVAQSVALDPELLHRALPDLQLVGKQARHLRRRGSLHFKRDLVEPFSHIASCRGAAHLGRDPIDELAREPGRAEQAAP